MARTLDKKTWLAERLLLNLGFVPKLFGFRDDDLYNLSQGRLKKWICGVEYYFGLTLKGTEERVMDFPQKLVSKKLITVMHAPFVADAYPKRIRVHKSFYRFVRLHVLARADKNPWHRLPKVIQVTASLGAKKLNIHASELLLATYPDKLFHELDKLSTHKKIILCLENNIRTPEDRKRDNLEWEATHNPIKLIEHIRKNNLENFFLTIDTGHLAGSQYDVAKKWDHIKQFVGKNEINNTISHFHLVDYNGQKNFDAEIPGQGVIGKETFQMMIDDLYHLQYTGTISFEVAPINFYRNRHRLVAKTLRRYLMHTNNLRQEEDYILGIIKDLL